MTEQAHDLQLGPKVKAFKFNPVKDIIYKSFTEDKAIKVQTNLFIEVARILGKENVITSHWNMFFDRLFLKFGKDHLYLHGPPYQPSELIVETKPSLTVMTYGEYDPSGICKNSVYPEFVGKNTRIAASKHVEFGLQIRNPFIQAAPGEFLDFVCRKTGLKWKGHASPRHRASCCILEPQRFSRRL